VSVFFSRGKTCVVVFLRMISIHFVLFFQVSPEDVSSESWSAYTFVFPPLLLPESVLERILFIISLIKREVNRKLMYESLFREGLSLSQACLFVKETDNNS
jgi:hypothetical protein